MNSIPLNPFADNIVSEPRRIEKSVEGLNDDALNQLLGAFRYLLQEGKEKQAPCACLVQSVAPGFGKSHLIGRLFHTLDNRATLIYLKPFQDPSSCWRSMLDKIVGELEYPDRADALACAPGELSQMDTFARHVVANMLAHQMECGDLPHIHKDQAVPRLRNASEDQFRDPAWCEWIQTNWDIILEQAGAGLRAHGIQLKGGRRAWIRVLLSMACCQKHDDLYEACLNWIRSQPLAEEEAEWLQLKPAEIPEVDLPYRQRNEDCFQRILDLCKLAAFYRPFVFCFDQTELYESSPELARSFGSVIFRLRDEALNLLLVITANQQVWNEKVVCHFEEAHRHRISSPIDLVGINARQAESLARNRLAAWNVAEQQILSFLSHPRLHSFFEAGKGQASVRKFLVHCAELWGQAPDPPSLEQIYQAYRAELLANPKKLQYDAGILQWVFQNLFAGRCGFRIQSFQSEKGYWATCWEAPDIQILFGFEEGSHWKRWQAIHREADRYFQANQRLNRNTRAVLFRVHEQSRIPGKKWAIRPKIEASVGTFFSIWHLDAEETASLYAAHDLYADVVQGNQNIRKEEALNFLSKKLGDWVDRVRQPPGTAAPPEAPAPPRTALLEALRAIVAQYPFITLAGLIRRLQERQISAGKEEIFKACEMIPGMKVFPSPSNAVFRWQSNP